MKFDQLPSGSALAALPMRARLVQTGVTAPSRGLPAWQLHHLWTSQEEEPILSMLELRTASIGGVSCVAAVGHAITERELEEGEDERGFVYLLSPADPVVWAAIDSWVQTRWVAALQINVGSVGAGLVHPELELLSARQYESLELESDMLGGAIMELLRTDRLASEVAEQLQIKVPLLCAVVETPMMVKSMEPVDDEEVWRLKEHEWNKWVNEGIWS